MKKTIGTATASLALTLALALLLPLGSPRADQVTSLRGDLAIPAENAAPPAYEQERPGKPFPRAFKQQPPLITHRAAKYKIDLKENRCLNCHDKSTYKKEEAPMASKTHYVDAKGVEQDHINMRRYFCTQCHVPQTNARPLVENSFVGIKATQ